MNKISFFEKCKGIALVFSSIALVLFAFSAVLFSTAPVQADAPQTIYATGRYQMSLTSIIDSRDASCYYLMVWDTETGRSRFYYGNVAEGLQKASDPYQLPASPL